MLEQLRRRMIAGILAGVVVVLAFVVLSDAGDLAHALRSFDWRLIPIIIFFTLLNYVLRFVKWQFYLRLLGVDGLSRRDSALIFVAGFTMVMTPGKVGELLKAWLVRVRTGASLARVAPVIFAERASDGIALLVLAGAGMTMFRHGWPLLVGGAILSIAGLALLQHEALMRRLLAAVERLRFARERAHHLAELYASIRSLLRPRPFAIAVGIGTVSWLCECLAFFLVLVGLDVPATWTHLLAAIFVFSAGTWIGGVSMLPGGIGAADLSIAALLLVTIDDAYMTASTAGVATLLIRFATLWFGVLLGILALSRVSGWTSTLPADADTSQPVRSIAR